MAFALPLLVEVVTGSTHSELPRELASMLRVVVAMVMAYASQGLEPEAVFRPKLAQQASA